MAINPLAIGAGVALASAVFKKKPIVAAPTITWSGESQQDNRARLVVPFSYIAHIKQGLGIDDAFPLIENTGIVFPYTPAISFERTAAWSPQSVIHSNYNFYSYKNSAVSGIRLSAKFTVQNDMDVGIYLSTVLLLNALTKMPAGTDTNAGSPPPVCRLFAYGGYMLDNVPVVVAGMQTEWPEGIDYYQTNRMLDGSLGTFDIFQGSNMVPTLSTITLNLIPVYSRYEQMNFNVTDMMKGTFSNKSQNPGRGYL